MRKVWILVLALTVLGCAKRDQNLHLTLSSWGDIQEAALLGQVCRMFEERNPGLKVDLQRVPYNEYTAKLMTQFTTGLAPDVIFVGSNDITEFHPRGMFTSLEGFLQTDREVDRKAYVSQAIERFTFSDGLVALPRDIMTVSCVYVNLDLFRKAGLPPPTDDWNWDAFLHAAQKLTTRDASGNVTCWGFTDEWINPDPWVMSMGGDWVDDGLHPRRYRVGDPAWVKGIQYRADLIHRYKVCPSPSAILALGGGSVDLFLNGKAAMLLTGIWKSTQLRDIKSFAWDCAMFPKGPTGRRGFVMGVSAYGISSTSKHKAEAWKLLKFLTGEEASRLFARAGFAQPALRKVASSSDFLDDRPPKNKGMLLKALDYGRWEPAALNWREVRNGIIGPALDRVWNGTLNAQEAVKEMTEELRKHPPIQALPLLKGNGSER